MAFVNDPCACAQTELLLRCRRPYCAVMATLERQAIAFVLSMLKVYVVIQCSELLCDPTASTPIPIVKCMGKSSRIQRVKSSKQSKNLVCFEAANF